MLSLFYFFNIEDKKNEDITIFKQYLTQNLGIILKEMPSSAKGVSLFNVSLET